MRCTDPKKAPEERIRYCQDMRFRAGYGGLDVWILTQIGRAYADEKDYGSALSYYDRAIGEAHSDSRAWTVPIDLIGALRERAELNAILGRTDEALADVAQVMNLDANSKDRFNFSCWIKAIMGKHLDSALDDCDRALAELPGNASVLDSRAFTEYKMGNAKGAITDYDSALAEDPKLPSSLYMRGIIREQSGNIAEGKQDIQAALSIDSGIAERFASYGIKIPAGIVVGQN